MNTIERITALAGSRVRVTWPNGAQKSGDVRIKTGSRIGLKPGYEPATYTTLGDSMVGGEYLNATTIEVMGLNGRYADEATGLQGGNMYYGRGERQAEEATIRRLREEYEDLMKQGRIDAAHNVLAARDRALLRLRMPRGNSDPTHAV